MDKLRLRQFASLKYGDPFSFLVELRKLEQWLPEAIPQNVRRLRTNVLKPERETRDAALFCVGMSARLGLPILMAPVEDQDFDFVATWSTDDTQHFCPVQLKELPPDDLNGAVSWEDLLNKLSKYSNSSDLTVVVRWNRNGPFDPAAVVVPGEIKLGGLWVFGCISADSSTWALWGDFARPERNQIGIAFDYPNEISSS